MQKRVEYGLNCKVTLIFFFYFCIPSAVSFAGIRLEVKPEKATIFPGEPCLLSVSYVNDTTREVSVHLGKDDIAFLSFRIFNNDRKLISSSGKLPTKGGLFVSKGDYKLSAGDSVNVQVILNRWISTLREPGDYIVQCNCASPGQPKWVSEYMVSIHPVEKSQIDHYFSNLLDEACESKNVARSILSMDLLSYANSPGVVPFLDKAIRINKLGLFFERKAMDGLERIGTKEAASSIVSLGQPEEKGGVSSDIIRNELISAACRLRDKSPDPEVREIARQLGGTIPSQEKPEVYD